MASQTHSDVEAMAQVSTSPPMPAPTAGNAQQSLERFEHRPDRPSEADRAAAINMLPNPDPTSTHTCDACARDIMGVSTRARTNLFQTTMNNTCCLWLATISYCVKRSQLGSVRLSSLTKQLSICRGKYVRTHLSVGHVELYTNYGIPPSSFLTRDYCNEPVTNTDLPPDTFS